MRFDAKTKRVTIIVRDEPLNEVEWLAKVDEDYPDAEWVSFEKPDGSLFTGSWVKVNGGWNMN